MNKLLCIVGPTASGKTSLAIQLSKSFPSILVSADSRQVYREMNIVTGKDHPANIRIVGLDIVNPDQDCSVAVWHRAVMPSIKQTWKDGQLPIIVGGTGLYIRSLTENIETMNIPRNPQLRTELEQLSASDLQDRLATIGQDKLTSLNQSDLHNPRRLVRAIEVATHTQFVGARSSRSFTSPNNLTIGLHSKDKDTYKKVIRARVIDRLDNGAPEEAQDLIKKYSQNSPSFSSLGYKHLIQYLDHAISKEKLIDDWTHSELSYAKRQLTWFKKIKNINWFDPIDSSTPSLVASLVKDWYSNQ